MRFITSIAIVVALTFSVAPAVAGKGGNGNGDPNGNTNGNGNGNSGYSPSLVATPDVLHSGDFFDVTGCGYETEWGNVIIGFAGGSWGSPLDANGCFTITSIPALSGDTLPPGTYPVTAYQYVRNGQLRKTGETTVTVVP